MMQSNITQIPLLSAEGRLSARRIHNALKCPKQLDGPNMIGKLCTYHISTWRLGDNLRSHSYFGFKVPINNLKQTLVDLRVQTQTEIIRG